MHKALAFLVLLFVVAFAAETVAFDNNWAAHPLFNVGAQSPAGVTVVFSTQRMVIEETMIDGVPMRTYGVPGIFLQNDEGAPNLAGTGRFLALPQGARAQVTILDSRTEVYHNVEVAPAPNIPLDTDDSPVRYVKDMKIYGRNAYYPQNPVQVSEPMKLRGVDVVILGITPFQYNPVTRELIVYKDLRVRVDFIGGNGHFGEDRLRNRYWEPILQGHLLNYTSLPRVDFDNRPRHRDNVEYIIIVPDDPIFEAWGDTIRNWRQLQGISAEVFTLTEVGGSSAAAIESFLNNAYNTWDPAPVAFLLLSDYPSSGRLYGITSPVWNSYCVSDNIYADVNGDDLPDMHHARFTAQDNADLSLMINKFLNYERSPYVNAHFHDSPLAACGWQTERWFQLATEVCRGFWINELGKNPSRQYNVYSGTPTPGCAWSSNANTPTVVAYFGPSGLGYIPATNPYDATWWNNGSAAGINTAVNDGAFMIQHRDHGNYDGWSEPDYTLPDLDGLTNDLFTFVNSTNCLTGAYDYGTEVFAEKFHRIEHGALGLNAASEVSYSFVNDTYIWGMFDCLWPQFMPDYPLSDMPGHQDLRPCMAMTYGKIFLAGSSWPYNPQNKVHTYHLFHHHTDAFVTLYSETPQNLSVSHPATITAGTTSFPVSANDSSIIALTVNYEIIGVAEGTGSPVPITIPAQTPGTIVKVTVTKANYYRYEVDVPVVSSNYPYVTITTDDVNDSGGDGIINPGETVDYGVWAKNVGTGTAQSVYGILLESDTYVTMTVDSAWYGDIAEDDSALSNPYYSFDVASNCPDGHDIDFTLQFHDINDSIFTSFRTLTVYAPVLTYQAYAVVGGNGNGILDPGETADLVVTLKNEGGASAVNVSSQLTTASSWITINDAFGNFGTIPAGGTADNSADPYNVMASGSTPYGTEIDFSVIVQSGLYCDTLPFTLVVGQLVPSDTGYYYSYYSGGPHTQSPVFEWMAIDTSQSQYPGTSLNLGDDAVTQVDLPFNFVYYGVSYNQITVGSDGWIAMGYQTAYDQTNSNIPNADGPSAMVAGLWDDLDPGNAGQPSDIYYYYDSVNHRFLVEYFKVEHWPSGYHETFEIILYDPVYYPTPTGDGEVIVQYLLSIQQADATLGIENNAETIGIQYYYDGTYHSLAATVTDSFAIKYTTYPPGYVGIKEDGELTLLPSRTMLNAIYPNPFRAATRIPYQVATSTKVSIRVFDAAGRLVRTLTEGHMQPGFYTALWFGDDNQDRTVPAGVYFVRFETDDYSKVQKTILMR